MLFINAGTTCYRNIKCIKQLFQLTKQIWARWNTWKTRFSTTCLPICFHFQQPVCHCGSAPLAKRKTRGFIDPHKAKRQSAELNVIGVSCSQNVQVCLSFLYVTLKLMLVWSSLCIWSWGALFCSILLSLI